MPKLPLDGIRVADFSWIIAGPLCTKNLGMLGAEVIKIETRKRPEFRGQRASFSLLNNSKKSCTIDLTQAKGRDLAKGIIRKSDVIVENFGYGAMDRLGLGYETLKALKPDIIMLSSSGLGRTGPDRDQVAYGNLLQGFIGWSALIGYPDGRSVGLGGAWTDPLTAITSTFAVLAALHHREETGEGQYIDLSMAEATLCTIPEALFDYVMNGRVEEPIGNWDEIMAPHGCYPCKGEDQWIALAVTNDEEWEALCQVIGGPSWAKSERFSDRFGRWKAREELDSYIGEWTRSMTSAEAMDILQKAGIPAGPSYNTEGLVNDPHLQARQLFVEIEEPDLGKRTTIGLPWKLEPGPGAVCFRAPMIGEHNDYVFKELLGLGEAEVAELVKEGVVE